MYFGQVYICFQNNGLCKNMFKVVLVLKQVTIRLKQCEIDIILRKNKQNVVLGSKVKLLNGICSMNLVKQFYVDSDDSIITLVVYIFLGSDKKYAGEVTLNVFEWEENVIHATQSKITNCPDKSSRIKYEFYYFNDEKVVDKRPFFMSQERHKQQYYQIENSNKVLSQEKLKLQEQIFKLHKKNQILESSRQDMVDQMNQRETQHKNQKGSCIESINIYSQQYSRQKDKRQGLIRLAQQHGLDQSGWSKQE